MADAKLKLEHKPFQIEVNDNGDCIEIDVLDLQFPLDFQKCYEKIVKIEQSAKAQELIINKKTDKDGDIMSKNQEEYMRMMNEKYKEMRVVLDDLFGEGASQKIFGNRNWLTMYHEFFSALVPILEQAGMTATRTFDAIKEKYGTQEGKEL